MMRISVTAAAAALALGGCGGIDLPLRGGGVPDDALGRWTLVSVNRADAVQGAGAYIEVEADRISGRSGCNSFGVPLTRIPDGVRFGDGQSTLMACSQDLMDQESSLMSVFEGVGRISVSAEGELVIIGGQGSSAVFRR